MSNSNTEPANKEPRDGSWVRHKMASELRWVRDNGGPLDAMGGFNPKTWKALFRAKALGVAIGRSKDKSVGAADGYSAAYLVVESSMNRGSQHAIMRLDLVAARARIKLRSASNAVDRMHRLGLWNKQERHGDDGEWTSNIYDFTEAKDVDALGQEATTVLHALKLITTSRTFDRTIERKNGEILKQSIKSRPPARMVVFVWVFDQIVLKQACARFTLNELVKGTGLNRRAAKEAVKGLLADGTFIKVDEGAVSLREAVGRPNSIVKRADGELWTEETMSRTVPALKKRKSKSVPETAEVRVPQSADGNLPQSADGLPESADGALQSADGDVFESADGTPESAQGVPETAYIYPAVFPAEKIPEGVIPPAAASCSASLNTVDSLPLVPASASGTPSALPEMSPWEVDESDDVELREAMMRQSEAEAMVKAALIDPGKGPDAQAEAIRRIEAALAHARRSDYDELSPQFRLIEAILAKTEHFEQRTEDVLWSSDSTAAMICCELLSGTREPPDLSDRKMTSTMLRDMSHGILVESEPPEDVLDIIAIAASRHDPMIIFGIVAEALRILYETGDCESTWTEIANSLACVLARARDEDLVVVPRPGGVAVDELARERTDIEADVTLTKGEMSHAQSNV